jgi:hypothetical protein
MALASTEGWAALMDVAEIAATLRSLPTVLEALLTPVDDATLRTRPAEDEWCPLEVIGHLIACDSAAFRDRIQNILDAEPDIAAFDAWEAIHARNFAAESLTDLIVELAQERARSCSLVESLSADDLAKTALFEGGRVFEAGDFVHEWPFHDQDHLQQILASLKLAYLPSMTPVMRAALTAE